MKTIYLAVSEHEMREYDIPDDVVPLDVGGVCPHGCKGTDPRWHFEGQVFNAALVVEMACEGRGTEYFKCSGGLKHSMPKRRAVFDRQHHLHILEAWQ